MNKKIIIPTLVVLIAIIAILAFTADKDDDSSQNANVQTATQETLNQAPDAAAASTTESTVKSYTLAEVATHNKASDCWMVIEGKVINPTEFIAKGLHPNDKIVNGCGKDATAMFESVGKHDGGRAQIALKQYAIGVLK